MGEIIEEYGGSLGILIMGCGILKILSGWPKNSKNAQR